MRAVDTGFNLIPCGVEKWMRSDLWELGQSGFILSGYEPPEPGDLELSATDPYGFTNPAPLKWADFLAGGIDQGIERRCDPGQWASMKELRTLIRALGLAVSSGVLLSEQHFVDGGYRTYAKPGAVVRWAKAKGYPIPLELESIAGVVAPIPADSTNSPAETIPPRTKGTLYDLLGAIFVAYNGMIPDLAGLQLDLAAKDCKEFDPDFLKETLKKVAEKVNKIK